MFVPHGFLHAFAVPEHASRNDAVFMYYCDDVYSKQDEVCVNPMSLLPSLLEVWEKTAKNDKHILWSLVQMLKSSSRLVLSEKDTHSQDYQAFMKKTLNEYREDDKLWYVKT